jgi:hypothetical protein
MVRLTGLVLSAVVLGAAPARAADYGMFVDIETEEDLLDLKRDDEISEQAFETLRELLEDGVELNTADRETLYSLPNLTYAEVDAILAYRKEAGRIDDPAVLVKAGVLSARKLGAIAPFLIITEKKVKLFTTHGRLKYGTTYVVGDKVVPSMYLSARVRTLKNLDVGLTMVLTRDQLGKPVYDPNRMALAAEPPRERFHVPKFHVQWETKKWHVMAGTYRIGFGQRLTFDNTSLYNPNGIRIDDALYYNQTVTRTCREAAGELGESPCTGEKRYRYHSPDYKWTERLRGVAFGAKKIKVGDKHWMQAYGFLSYQTHDIYQYEVFNRARCDDPAEDDLPGCKAPNVYRLRDDRLAPTTRFSFHTLPAMYNELLGGGNVTYFFSRRKYIGITGYGATVDWLVEGMDPDFQEWSTRPYGGPFGAVGLNAAYGYNWLDLFGEVAYSIDSMHDGGGGPAAILRSLFTLGKKKELELTARYYDKGFANPYARPIAAADEYDGLRARDELGFRARFYGKLQDIYLRTRADWWTNPAEGWRHQLRLRVRADYEVATWFKPGAWVEYRDKDVSDTGRDNCYAVSSLEDIEGEPIECQGEKIDLGVRLRFEPLKELTLTAFYQHRFADDHSNRYDSSFRMDSSFWFLAMYKPIKNVRLRARVRYRFEALLHNDYLEQSVWAYLEAQYWFKRIFRIKARFEVLQYLDERESSDLREPSPELWARLELEYRF